MVKFARKQYDNKLAINNPPTLTKINNCVHNLTGPQVKTKLRIMAGSHAPSVWLRSVFAVCNKSVPRVVIRVCCYIGTGVSKVAVVVGDVVSVARGGRFGLATVSQLRARHFSARRVILGKTGPC